MCSFTNKQKYKFLISCFMIWCIEVFTWGRKDNNVPRGIFSLPRPHVSLFLNARQYYDPGNSSLKGQQLSPFIKHLLNHIWYISWLALLFRNVYTSAYKRSMDRQMICFWFGLMDTSASILRKWCVGRTAVKFDWFGWLDWFDWIYKIDSSHM